MRNLFRKKNVIQSLVSGFLQNLIKPAIWNEFQDAPYCTSGQIISQYSVFLSVDVTINAATIVCTVNIQIDFLCK